MCSRDHHRVFNDRVGEARTALTLPQFMMVGNAIVRYQMPEREYAPDKCYFSFTSARVVLTETGSGRLSKPELCGSQVQGAVQNSGLCSSEAPCGFFCTCFGRFAAEKQLVWVEIDEAAGTVGKARTWEGVTSVYSWHAHTWFHCVGPRDQVKSINEASC